MTIKEIINRVTTERQVRGRFPSRLIFAHNFSDYQTLVDELTVICDITLDLANFTDGDVVPRFKDLKAELAKSPDRQILLLSMGEYLRLCAKRETDKATSEFPGIWEQHQSESYTTKYIMPLFGGRELFDSVVPLIDERQENFLWELSDNIVEDEYTITVYSPPFAKAIQTDAGNLQEWLQKWPALFGDMKRRNFSLTTKLFKYTEPLFGNGKVEVVDEPFAYIVSLAVDGNKLKKEYGNEQFWTDVAKGIKCGELFSATIIHILNAGHRFDPVSILARFEQLSDTERRLLWVWYKLYPLEDYYTYALSKAVTPEDIPLALRDAVFTLPKISDNYVSDRANALKVLTLSYNDEYFAKLDKLAAPEMRLSLLTYGTLAERAYAIKTVSGLLRCGADISVVTKLLQSGYSELSAYLAQNGNDEVSLYFNWYRQNKLINRCPSTKPYSVDFDGIDSRNKVIQQSGDCYAFWVDGCGIEWLPLLVSKLNKLSLPVKITAKVARCMLPSETKYNHQWGNADDKWDRLDKLSHAGMPDEKDYFLCIARQIEIIGEVVEHIGELLENHNSIIVTGDHGSSRLAALMFHVADNFAITPPKNAIVHSFGRFCEIKDTIDVPTIPGAERVELKGETFIVMKTYEHFKQSGNAAGGNTDDNAVRGEVHGGMTPEEYLVPVIVISRKNPLAQHDKIENNRPKAANLNDIGI